MHTENSGVNVQAENSMQATIPQGERKWADLIGGRATRQGQARNSLQPSHVRSLGGHWIQAWLVFCVGLVGLISLNMHAVHLSTRCAP